MKTTSRYRAHLCILALLGLFILTGCSSLRGYPKKMVSESEELKHLASYFTDDVIKAYNAKADEPSKRAYRDEVVNGRLRAIDLQFEVFQKAINSERNLSQIGSDWAVLGLSGAGTIVGGATSKAILAAISGGLTGAKLSVDKTLYYEKTMPSLLSQMEANRSRQLVNIRIGLQQSNSSYPLTQALVDVDGYYKAGTLPGAIIAINSAAGAKNENAQDALKQILEGSYKKDAAGDTLRKFWKPNGTDINRDNEKKLKKWMGDNGFDPDAITLFLRNAESADARVKAVKDLGLGQ
jgi:hypothetical protein